MYEELPPNPRSKHPYYMYDEIREQPEAVEHSLELAQEHGADVCRILAGARRVFVAGSGTSLHAAEGSAWMLRSFSRGKIDARAIQSFEFVSYLPGLRPDDVLVVVSHSGGTEMALRALERAHRSGVDTVAVTGFPDSKVGQAARHVLPTGFPREQSWAHTASYTSALASMASVANNLAEPSERLDLSPLPAAVRDAMDLEEVAHRLAAGTVLAERHRGPADIVFVGGGPNGPTAREAQLKVLETSFVQAGAYELEQILHGPLAAIKPETVLVVVAPSGQSTERAAGLVRAARQLGASPVVLVSPENADAFDEAHRMVLPEVPEVLSPMVAVVPLQFFSYFLSVGYGNNPDLIHRDVDEQRNARAQYA